MQGPQALAILVDATLMRAVLLPVAVRRARRANSWAPPPLRRLHAMAGFSEAAAPEPVLPREYV